MAYLTKAQIVEAQALRTDDVDVPEWGGKVLVRELTTDEILHLVRTIFAGAEELPSSAEDVSALLASGAIDMADLIELFPQVVAWGIVDEDLKPVLALGDVLQFAGRSFEPIQRVATRVLELSEFVGPGGEDGGAGAGEDRPAAKNQ